MEPLVAQRDKVYPWHRYWCPPAAEVRLDLSGYVLNPEGDEWTQALNPNLVRFKSIDHFQCLILLGEPGSGKSYELANEVQARVTNVDGGLTQLVDLRRVQSRGDLEDDLFSSETFEKWKSSGKHLHLFLDSLDECLIEAPRLTSLLLAGLRETDRKRLSLRITCRSAIWEPRLGRELASLWSEEQTETFELMHLRREDVEIAAQEEGVDPKAFLEAIEERALAPLAVIPVTLKFLLREFAQSGTFPKKLTELYRAGCLQLCREQRRELTHKGKVTNAEKLAVAERLAAITVFSGIDRFWLDEEQDAPPEATDFPDLAYGEEPISSGVAPAQVKVSEGLVRETLRTSLFTSRGSGQVGWTNFTYAEFLAASYLTSRCKGRTVEMLRQIGEYDGRLVPQVRQTAAWAAGLDQEVHKYLFEHDRDALLLRGDLDLVSETDREALVEHVLSGAASGREFSRQSFRGLARARLAEQLRPVIADRNHPFEMRQVAIDMAESCRPSGIAELLADVALDTTEKYPIRCNAAAAVARIGDTEAAERLRPLLGGGTDDPRDDLRGAALHALWGRSLTIHDLVSALKPPRSPLNLGGYQMFLSSLDFSKLPASELALMIDWAAEQKRERASFDSLMSQLAVLGLQQLDDPNIASATARLVATLLRRDRSLVTMRGQKDVANLLQEPGRRRELVSLLVPRIAAGELRPSALLFSGYRLLLPEDAPWLRAELKVAAAEETPVWEPDLRANVLRCRSFSRAME